MIFMFILIISLFKEEILMLYIHSCGVYEIYVHKS